MFCFTEIQQCTHIKATGHRCGSPALKGKFYCYFHSGLIRGVKRPIDSQIESVSILENPESIQVALMHAHSQVTRKEIDYRTGVLLVRILNLAIRNGRRANFNWNQDEMVRELPNYGEQYLVEHPELDSPEPDREIVINKKDDKNEDTEVAPAAAAPMPASPAITSPAFAAKTEPAAPTSGAPEPALSLSKGSRPFFGANLGSDALPHVTPPAVPKTTTAAAAPAPPAIISRAAPTTTTAAAAPAPPAVSSPAIASLAAKTKSSAAAARVPHTIIPPAAATTTTAAAAQKFARQRAGRENDGIKNARRKNASRNNRIHKITRPANRVVKVVALNPSSTVSAAAPAHPREPIHQPNLLHADTMRDIRERINRARRGNLTDMKTLFDIAGIFPNRRNGNTTTPPASG